jgi:hypothetical protein
MRDDTQNAHKFASVQIWFLQEALPVWSAALGLRLGSSRNRRILPPAGARRPTWGLAACWQPALPCGVRAACWLFWGLRSRRARGNFLVCKNYIIGGRWLVTLSAPAAGGGTIRSGVIVPVYASELPVRPSAAESCACSLARKVCRKRVEVWRGLWLFALENLPHLPIVTPACSFGRRRSPGKAGFCDAG